MFLVNGQVADNIELADRGLHYGDGLFETIAVRDGRIEFWSRHLRRLKQGCERLGLPVINDAVLLQEIKQVVAAKQNSIIKIIITRGSGGRGYKPPAMGQAQTTRVIGCYPWPEKNNKEITIRVCSTPLGINPVLAGMKHLNRLEQVLARQEWSDETVYEGLMSAHQGHVIEGTMSNVFFVKEGELCTPDLSDCGVAGIIREVVIEIAQQNQLPFQIGNYELADIRQADELFLTNSLIGIYPVRQLQGQQYSIGSTTCALIEKLDTVRQQKDEYEAA